MPRTEKERTSQKTRAILYRIGETRIASLSLLALGLLVLVFSIIYTSSILGFIGLGLTFWGALLLYITPSKHVQLEFLNAMVTPAFANIEKTMNAFNLKEKGTYLPPEYSGNVESSLVFIPSRDGQTLPNPADIDEEKLYRENPNGILLAPPGIALAKLFEKTLGTSFNATDLNHIQKNLPKLLIEDMQIAEDVNLNIDNNTITVEIINHIFTEVCQETQKLRKAHTAVGCPLSSAIAIVLTQVTHKPVVIERSSLSGDARTTETQYRIIEE
jgi:hypothetical protein